MAEVAHINEFGDRVFPLHAVDPRALANVQVPERKFIVEGLIPANAVTMLTGDGGLGKSLLTLQLMTCCATGKYWLGQETAKVKALGIYCEDDAEEIHIRQSAINKHYGIGFEDLGNVRWVSRVDFENSLCDFKEAWERGGYGESEKTQRQDETMFFTQIGKLAEDFGAHLVILDSLHDLFAGNENSRPHARHFIGLLRRLARHIEGAVVLCAHPSLNGMSTGSGSAGSTAWNNAVRSRLYLTRPKDDEDTDTRELKTMKANYGKTGDVIKLRWMEGVFVNEDALPTDNGMVANIEKRNFHKKFLDALGALVQQERATSENARAGNYLPKIMQTLPEMKRVPKAKIEQAMYDLLADGVIGKNVISRNENRHDVWGLAQIGDLK